MKFFLFNIGKTSDETIKTGVEEYCRRIKHFVDFSVVDLHEIKSERSFTTEIYKQKEGEIIKKAITKIDIVIILDENGTEYDSQEFAKWISKILNQGKRQIAFVTGGAYGFSEELYRLADYKVSLSRMTFTHQLVRLVFVEQLYRALTIIKGLPYHND